MSDDLWERRARCERLEADAGPDGWSWGERTGWHAGEPHGRYLCAILDERAAPTVYRWEVVDACPCRHSCRESIPVASGEAPWAYDAMLAASAAAKVAP